MIPLPGSVVSFKDFEFHDGDKEDKLLIVLNDKRNDIYLVLKATSQSSKWRQPNEGCHHDKGYYYIPKGKAWFRKETWIVLDDPYEMPAYDLEENGHVLAEIDDQLRRAITNCFKKTEDCSDFYIWLME